MTTTTTELEELNRFLAGVAADRRKALWAAIRDRDTNGTPIPAEVSNGWEDANGMLHKSVTRLAMNSLVGQPVETADGRLIVASVGFIGEAILDRNTIQVVLTEDGGIAKRAFWHSTEEDGPTGDSVRYEVYDANGRVSHGFIDSRSRRIVQTG